MLSVRQITCLICGTTAMSVSSGGRECRLPVSLVRYLHAGSSQAKKTYGRVNTPKDARNRVGNKQTPPHVDLLRLKFGNNRNHQALSVPT